MKKMVSLFIGALFIICFSIPCFASIEKTGEYYRYREGEDFAYSTFVYDNNKKYYAGENGYIAVNTWVVVSDKEKYYASSDGSLYVNTIEIIDGKGYAFDYDGKVMYGWINDGLFYANDEGYLVTGFQQLTVMDDTWITDKKKIDSDSLNEVRWFYFLPSGSKKYQKFHSEDRGYDTWTIDEKKYCFNENGIICTGWRKIKDKTPTMSGYMYFCEEETNDFSYGQAITNSWYACEASSEDGDNIGPSGEVRYFYFLPTGEPICAKNSKYMKHKITNKNTTKTYCFNQNGYAVYGIKEIDGDYYYFGDSVTDCSMRTGKVSINTGSGYKMEYYFDDNGKGYTGVYKDKLYYKGLLQKATDGVKCQAYDINGTIRLVNSSGSLLKSKNKYKDQDGVAWSTNSMGVVTYCDESIAGSEPNTPEETGD